MDFVLRNTTKAMREDGINEKLKLLLTWIIQRFGYTSEMNGLWRFQGARIDLTINFKETASLKLGINEDKKEILGNVTTDWVSLI